MPSNEDKFFMHAMFRFPARKNSRLRTLDWRTLGCQHEGMPSGGNRCGAVRVGACCAGLSATAGFQLLLALLLSLILAGRGRAAQESHALAEKPAVEIASPGSDRSPGHGAAGDSGHGDLGHGNAGPNLENPAEFRGDMAIYTFVVFLLLLAILGKFAWPAITAALEERERNIEAIIAATAEKHEEAKKLLAEHEARLAEASGEVRELLEEARRDADRTKAQIVEEAKKTAGAERDRAIREIDMATEAAMQRLAETSANLAVDLAGKVVRTHITQDQQAQLVRDALARLAQSSPSDN